MNYTELQAAVQAYVENDDSVFVAQLPTFITQAEKRIYNTVQFPALRKTSLGALTISNRFVSCPSDFLSAYSLAVVLSTGEYRFLLNKDATFIREAYSSISSTGIPRYYALFGPQYSDPAELSLIVAPTPNAAYTVELQYFFYPESITTAASGTTWLGDNYDPVLLYGTLVEAYTYMKGEQDMLALYQGKYTEALAQAKRLGDAMERQDAYRSGQYRQEVT
jgi:hypothetical protein